MRSWLLLGVLAFVVGCSDSEEPLGPTPAPGDVVETQVQLGNLLFDARTAGPEDGELVILLHGFPQTSYEWRAQLSALGEAGYRAFAPDQRGYSPGARPNGIDDYALPLLVADVLALADELGAQRFHVVGHDWGAAVAWGLAAGAPDRIISLTAVSVPHPDAFDAQLADENSCQYQASAYFDFFLSPTATSFFIDDDAAQLRAIYEGVSADAIDEYVSALGTEPAMDAALNWYRANVVDRRFVGGPAGAISVPTLFIWSDGDTAICQEGADATGDFVSGPYRYEVLADVNHWVPDIAAAEVSQLLVEQVGSAQ